MGNVMNGSSVNMVKNDFFLGADVSASLNTRLMAAAGMHQAPLSMSELRQAQLMLQQQQQSQLQQQLQEQIRRLQQQMPQQQTSQTKRTSLIEKEPAFTMPSATLRQESIDALVGDMSDMFDFDQADLEDFVADPDGIFSESSVVGSR